ncbi:DUF6767 domain-containing protein [Arcanobacterium ihumii]|uniref:DUF6767 domain-containing protein n=1 Tax=Arcanobacterium ihumii TaxID=2138162 RepID=UPI000F52A0E3|nr:DUF6767 domain-containing protein [Arcanobacterium ihumii]
MAKKHVNQPECPIRFGEPCTLCQAFVTGPEDCQTVALVMTDPELREEWARRRREYIKEKKAKRVSESQTK